MCYLKQLIVLGNGFDLACGLKSSYADFFLQRFSELFCDGKAESLEEIEPILKKKQKEILQKLWEISNASYQKFEEDFDYFKRYSDEWCSDCNFNRWDVFFLFAQLCIGKGTNLYEWQDVELIIFEVISIALGKEYTSKISYKEEVTVGLKEMNGKKAFEDLVLYISRVSINNSSEIANELLNELKKFEAIFSKYIAEQVDINNPNSKYINNALDELATSISVLVSIWRYGWKNLDRVEN